MFHTTRGIVIHTHKFGDNSLIAMIYTESFGRMSFMLQGIRGKKTQVKANLLKQLYLLEMEVDHKPGRELQRVREIKNIAPFGSIPFGVAKSTQAIFLAEILGKVLHEEEARTELFEFLFHSIQILDLLNDGINNFHLVFLLQLTRFLGFSPTNNYSEANPIFDMIGGKFVSLPPPHPWFLKISESRSFALVLDLNYQNSSGFKPVKGLRPILLDSILDFYSLHLGNKLNLKSLEIIREVLH